MKQQQRNPVNLTMSKLKSFTLLSKIVLLAVISLKIYGCNSVSKIESNTKFEGDIMSQWKNVLTLNSERLIINGSEKTLSDAIRRGADLRIYTTFRHNEHLEPGSDNTELVEEVSKFDITYLIDDKWSTGIMAWRQPVLPLNIRTEFGPPSMSFFLYNQNGEQAIARPYLDGREKNGQLGQSILDDPGKMPKYHQKNSWDAYTNAPSSNFVYDFGEFRYFVRNDWQEVLSHTANGTVIEGSVDKLARAFEEGAELKVAITGLCDDLVKEKNNIPEHEVFVNVGAGYYYTEEKLFIAGTHHLVRVAPAIPMVYKTKNWDFGWVIVRTDGLTVIRICDPYTLKFTDSTQHCAIRWFVR